MTTPEATPTGPIEAVIDGALGLYHWEAFESQVGDIAEAVEDVIRKAVANAAPFIAAHAKAEALREAAAIEPLDRVCTSCGAKRGNACYGNGPMRTPHPNRMLTQDWLRARAATIEGKSE